MLTCINWDFPTRIQNLTLGKKTHDIKGKKKEEKVINNNPFDLGL